MPPCKHTHNQARCIDSRQSPLTGTASSWVSSRVFSWVVFFRFTPRTFALAILSFIFASDPYEEKWRVEEFGGDGSSLVSCSEFRYDGLKDCDGLAYDIDFSRKSLLFQMHLSGGYVKDDEVRIHTQITQYPL